MNIFTKTLLASAMALAATGAAEARIADVAQAANFDGSEMVLSVWNMTKEKSYSLDLGVKQSTFLSGDYSGINRSVTDANFTSFTNAILAGDDVRYSLSSASNTGSTSTALVGGTGPYAALSKKNAQAISYGLITSGTGTLTEFAAVTADSAALNPAMTAVANNISNLNSATDQSAASDALNVSLYAAVGEVGYAGDATWGTNMNSTLGSFSTMAAINNSTNLFRASKSGTVSPVTIVKSQYAEVLNFSVAGGVGTLSFALAPVVSAVPVPAAVWMFGAGLMGVLRLNRRKVVAA